MLEGRIVLEGGAGELARERITDAYFGLAGRAGRAPPHDVWVNQLLQGVLLGGYYALIACGLSFMFGVMRIINLAHGSLAVLAAFALFVLADQCRHLAVPRPADRAAGAWRCSAGCCIARCSTAACAAGMLVPLLSTFGLAIVLDNLLFEAFGADTRSLAPYIGELSYDSWAITDDIAIGQLAVLTFAIAVVLLGGLQLFLSRTPLGRAIRATAEDPDTVGLDRHRCRARLRDRGRDRDGRRSASPARSSRCAQRSIPIPAAPQLIFAFEAVVIGGVGSLWGTLLGGIVLGAGAEHRRADHAAGLSDRRPRRLPDRAAGRVCIAAACGFAGHAARHERAGRIERWTRPSVAAVVLAALLVVLLAFGPLVLDANAVDKLTTLFIYVILGAMWNALAGYGGLVSVGQQAFFGLGAYVAVRLSDAGVPVYPALLLAAVVVAACRCRSPYSCCGCAAASSRSACGWWPNWRICWSISTGWCRARPGRR